MRYDNPPSSDALYLGDGEWMSWGDFDAHYEEQELRARYPHGNLELLQIFEDLICTASEYHEQTGRHLQIYGDIGEIFGEIAYGIKLNKNYAKGSDGRLGNDLVEIKTITPFKAKDIVYINLDRNFSKILIVKIDKEFEIHAKMIDRKSLSKKKGKLRINWNMVKDNPITPSAPHP